MYQNKYSQIGLCHKRPHLVKGEVIRNFVVKVTVTSQNIAPAISQNYTVVSVTKV